METPEVFATLKSYEGYRVSFAIGLYRPVDAVEPVYDVVRLVAYVIPADESWEPWTETLDYDYGQWRIMRHITGTSEFVQMLEAWFGGEVGAVADGVVSKVNVEVDSYRYWDDNRLSSFQQGLHIRAPHPAQWYMFRRSRNSANAETRPLVKRGLPYFPSAMQGFARLIDGAENASNTRTDYRDLHIHLFLLDDRASIPHVFVRSGHAEVMVGGTVHDGMELKMYSDQGMDVTVPLTAAKSSYTLEWEDMPDRAEWVTTLDDEIIDRRTFARQSVFGANDNVSIDYGESATLEYLVAQGESLTVEFKDKLPEGDKGAKEFLESVSAFANTRGGTILVGISDNGVVHGVTEDPKWKDRLTEILRNRMEPVPDVEMREAVYKGSRIYVIDVVQGGDPPYAVDIHNPIIYVRRGANDYYARRLDLDEMYASKYSDKQAITGPYGNSAFRG